jgi:hypothetical protein
MRGGSWKKTRREKERRKRRGRTGVRWGTWMRMGLTGRAAVRLVVARPQLTALCADSTLRLLSRCSQRPN